MNILFLTTNKSISVTWVVKDFSVEYDLLSTK